MQNPIDQAAKNGVTLVDKGKCQFCGADFERGIFDCIDNYSNGLQLLDLSNPEHQVSRFLSVDAHALQHPEIHGRWSNHFHLTRLNLIIDKKQKWDYKKSPLLSDYLNVYKSNRPDEFLVPPMPWERGNITAKDLTKERTVSGCIELVRKWAEDVYFAWSSNHIVVAQIAQGFLDRNVNNKLFNGKTTNH
jgi:hypothetical protein